MSTKSLKKQLMAAIAMVLVAAIALGSSTFAWFISNNTVNATTSTISAQSNAAFMVIEYNATAVNSDKTADVATIGDTPLYPAKWNQSSGKFETAYAQKVGEATMKADTLKEVGDPAAAVTAKYAVCNTFNISAKGANLSALKVAGASIETANKGNDKLDNALRVLVVSPTGWVLCNNNGVVADSTGGTDGTLGDAITAGADTVVNLYVYYDGDDSQIFTNNLANLKTASSKITVQFEATADNH